MNDQAPRGSLKNYEGPDEKGGDKKADISEILVEERKPIIATGQAGAEFKVPQTGDHHRTSSYRDFSQVVAPEPPHGEVSRKEPNFQSTVHAMVSNEDFPEIVWLDHGRRQLADHQLEIL